MAGPILRPSSSSRRERGREGERERERERETETERERDKHRFAVTLFAPLASKPDRKSTRLNSSH